MNLHSNTTKKIIILSSLILAFSAFSAHAETYYVDNTIVDTNVASDIPDCVDYNPTTFSCGTGGNSVFSTLADINTFTALAPGDSILLRRGQIFRESLGIPSSGATGNPITYGAFGSGIKPTIYGSELLDGTWNLESGNIYSIALPILTDTVLNGTTLLTQNDGNFSTLSNGEWDQEAGVLYVNIGTDPSGGAIEAGQRPYVIAMSNKDHITINDLIIRNGEAAGIYTISNTANNTGITINNVEVYGTGNDGFKQETSNSFTNTVEYNNVISRFNVDDGLSLHAGGIATVNTGLFSDNVSGVNNINDSQITLNNVTIEDNTNFGIWILNPAGGVRGETYLNDVVLRDNQQQIVLGNDQSLYAENITIEGGVNAIDYGSGATGNITISDVNVMETTGGSFILNGSGDVEMDRVKINQSGGAGIFNNIQSPGALTVSNLEIVDAGARSINISGTEETTISNATISNTLSSHVIEVLAGASLDLSYSLIHNNLGGTFSVLVRPGAEARIRNNTFVDNGRGVFVGDITELYNNIFVGHDAALWFTGGSESSLTLSNNLLFDNVTNFQGAAIANTNGVDADPLFTDRVGNDYTLTSSSPAIDNGLDLSPDLTTGIIPSSTWVDNVITDLQENYNSWEIGAFLFTDITLPDPTIDPIAIGDTTITGTGKNNTIITLDIGACTNAPVVVSGGVWSCSLWVSIDGGETITATSSDLAGNIATVLITVPVPEVDDSPSSSRRLSQSEVQQRFTQATNTTTTEDSQLNESNPFNGDQCPSHLIVTNNMKQGDRNGQYSSYNQGTVTQVNILQQHMNRLLLDEYGNQASGPIDGIFGPLTKQGVERLQRRLNQLLPDMTPLTIDGIVGPFTKSAINQSC